MRKYFAEFLAAFFFVFAGVGAIVADQQLAVVQVRESFGPLGVALAHGIALAVAIAAIARISGGHANPAVSLAFFVTGRINAKDLLGYVVGQLLGGIAAAFLIRGLFPFQAVDQTGVGTPAVQEQLNLFQGIAIEIVLTFLLVTVIWGVAVDRKAPKGFAPLAIGLTYSMIFLVGAAFTGAAANPARWFGPALASGAFGGWQVWIVGPAVGALLAALLYESFFSTDGSNLPAEPEDGDFEAKEVAAGDRGADDSDLETVSTPGHLRPEGGASTPPVVPPAPPAAPPVAPAGPPVPPAPPPVPPAAPAAPPVPPAAPPAGPAPPAPPAAPTPPPSTPGEHENPSSDSPTPPAPDKPS